MQTFDHSFSEAGWRPLINRSIFEYIPKIQLVQKIYSLNILDRAPVEIDGGTFIEHYSFFPSIFQAFHAIRLVPAESSMWPCKIKSVNSFFNIFYVQIIPCLK